MAVNVATMEEWLFNHPDPYNLAEIECVDEALQTPITWSSDHFDIAKLVKLNDPKLVAIITNVDKAGPGSTLPTPTQNQKRDIELEGIPGQWSVASFLGKM